MTQQDAFVVPEGVAADVPAVVRADVAATVAVGDVAVPSMRLILHALPPRGGAGAFRVRP